MKNFNRILTSMSRYGKTMGIKDWSADDQPRHKLKNKGAHALSDSELLAILIGSGSGSETAVSLCRRILQFAEHDLEKLAKLSIRDLMSFKGIGEAKAISIIAALEIGKRRKYQSKGEKTKIISSHSAYQVLAPILSGKTREEFWVVYLDQANQVIESFQISLGGVAVVSVDIKVIFKKAVELLARGLILAHNHPSGQLEPSDHDRILTEKIKSGGVLLDLKVLDHLIIGHGNYLSFADEGLL